ncbi:Sigma factor RpoE regulatory protein RseC [Thioalkalivibrio nitratireducens DSM 14787]|uniref:Sigma factor RpoE regulatory protein RseC n=1 Tax=Thioalkalivibrio nitratireducens (strain DSM 14787 / UNIQEM 213 / ALEN2) TaxID=1255043 RepID=L0DU24_THIND|nr:SoxR reducing system RseC family protein [Thioalkalivibrio nitratireducens]AGA32512.1 Sigma factor RpoE regulatory protein RseC [Thioalkalivibrio nitratireducens DSM 14787]
MTAWIEERGVVLAADAQWATVRMQRQSTCGSCSARSGCGNGVLAEVLGRRALELRLPNHQHGLHSGDRVILGVEDRALVSSAFAMYLLPLLGLIAVPVAAGWAVPAIAEGWLVLAGAAGFAAGLVGVRRWLRGQGRRLEPILLGVESVRTQVPGGK